MAKRSSVPVLAGIPARTSGDNYHSESITTRRIDNGWIVREEVCDNGKYSSKEVYSPTMPKETRTDAGTDSLRDAVKSIRR